MAEHSGLKVFISWSGDLAKQVAIRLHELIPMIFDGVQPWMSDQDIEAGSRGLDEIARELDGTSFGIIVVTNANQASQWLNFEAGAISKRVDAGGKVRVVPLLVDLSGAELTGPMTQFQWKLLDEEGVGELLVAIGGAVGVRADVVERRLAAEWEDFAAAVQTAKSKARHPSRKPRRTVESMMEETLELVRAMASERPITVTAGRTMPAKMKSQLARAIEAGLSNWNADLDVAVRRMGTSSIVEIHDPQGVLDVNDPSIHGIVVRIAADFGLDPMTVSTTVNGDTAIPF